MMEAVRFIASKFQLEDLPTYEVLEHYLHSDKKKQNGKQKMVLLNAIGEPAIVTVQSDSIKEALRFYQQLKDNKC
jgi:3-dehydroquinate synthetase